MGRQFKLLVSGQIDSHAFLNSKQDMAAPAEEKPVATEEQQEQHQEQDSTTVETPQSRGEKKARKAILGLGLKPVPDITRVTFTRARGVSCVLWMDIQGTLT